MGASCSLPFDHTVLKYDLQHKYDANGLSFLWLCVVRSVPISSSILIPVKIILSYLLLPYR